MPLATFADFVRFYLLLADIRNSLAEKLRNAAVHPDAVLQKNPWRSGPPVVSRLPGIDIDQSYVASGSSAQEQRSVGPGTPLDTAGGPVHIGADFPVGQTYIEDWLVKVAAHADKPDDIDLDFTIST